MISDPRSGERASACLATDRLVRDYLPERGDALPVDWLLEHLRERLDRLLEVGLVVLKERSLIVLDQATEKEDEQLSAIVTAGTQVFKGETH